MSFKDLRAKRDARRRDVDGVTASLAGTVLSAESTSDSSAPSAPSAPASSPGASLGAPSESAPAPEKSKATMQWTAPRVSEVETTPSRDAALYPELQGTGLEVRVAPRSGRGLYAARAISAGE